MEAHISGARRKRNMPNRTCAGKELWPDELKRKFADMWARDMPIKLISFEIGKSVASVKGMRLIMGLPPRKGKAAEGTERRDRLRLHLTEAELDSVRKQAHYHRRTPQAYLRMLLKRDGAL